MDQYVEKLLRSLSTTAWGFFVGQIAIVAFIVCGVYLCTLVGFFKQKKVEESREVTFRQSNYPVQSQSGSSDSTNMSMVVFTPPESLSAEDDLDSLPLSLEAAIRFNKNAEVISFVRLVGRNSAAQERYNRLLRCAVTEGNEFILRFLLENAIDQTFSGFDLEFLLWLAVKFHHHGAIKILLTHVPKQSIVVKSLVEFAVRESCLPLLDSLWPLHFDADSLGRDDILWEAAYLGHIDVVRFLVSRICTDQCSLDLALHAAVLGCHENLVKLLLDYGASANPSRNSLPESSLSLLHTAAANANTAIVSMLLDHGADLHLEEENKSGPLQAALHALNRPVYDLLVNRGADEFAIPLSTAIHARHKKVVLKLLHQGARETQYCGLFGSLLQMVCARGDEDMACFLISCGFQINPDSPVGLGGNSPLMAAVSSGNHRLVELLIARGASMRGARSEFGNVLQTAVFWGYSEVVRVLLDNSFDIGARSGPLPDALTVAIRKRNRGLVSMLLQRGASTRDLGLLDRDALIHLMK